SIQTKPRAMNTALPFLRGAIVGVYDAEDAPHPKQVLTVAGAFAASAQTACVQAPLDIYNTDQSWLSACFTVEYATLFRRQNPSLAAKNWPLPLGGTSFFIRKDVLKSLGGWDAFNVTEDADLGLRLHQAGYQTKMIAPPTLEEAPTDIAAWVKQRSRWLKGFLLTWMTTRKDSRSVLAAYLLLGPIVAAVTGVLTVPLWIMTLGFEVIEPTGAFYAFTAIAIMSEISLAAIGWLALRAKSHRHLRWVLPLMPVYRLLLIPAAIKAVIEAVFAPVFWDKTRHGQSG
ncbi:MAG: glycosyltransferase family 2 protein, partial [Pseudomonadota bacterium]